MSAIAEFLYIYGTNSGISRRQELGRCTCVTTMWDALSCWQQTSTSTHGCWAARNTISITCPSILAVGTGLYKQAYAIRLVDLSSDTATETVGDLLNVGRVRSKRSSVISRFSLARGTWTRPFWNVTGGATVKTFLSLQPVKSTSLSGHLRISCYDSNAWWCDLLLC